jgi:hypothetical protein
MSLTSKHVKALLRDPNLKTVLLRNKELSLHDYENFDNLSYEKLDIAAEEVINTLEAYAPFNVIYSSPVEGLPDDATIYGANGIYLLRNQDGCVFFTNKKEVLKYAGGISAVSWDVAEAQGYEL